jgi:hypothetical protein
MMTMQTPYKAMVAQAPDQYFQHIPAFLEPVCAPCVVTPMNAMLHRRVL